MWRHQVSPGLAAVFPVLLLAACGGERRGTATCGLAQLAGPTIIYQQLEDPRRMLTAAPRGLPPELPARVVAQPPGRAAVEYSGEQLAVTYNGAGFPADSQIGFGVLVVDDTSQRVIGVLIYDADVPRGRPQLGSVTSGERSVPLFGVRVSWADVTSPGCPLLGDTAAAATR